MKSTTDTICRGALATLALCLLCASCQYEAAVDALDEKLEGIASDIQNTFTAPDAYEAAMDAFFSALDEGDKEAARSLFSPAALAADEDLDETLEALMDLWTGPLEINERFGMDETSKRLGPGRTWIFHQSTRFLQAGGQMYWCCFSLTEENDPDPGAIGVTRVVFYTIDAFCNFQAGRWEPEDGGDLGLAVYDGPPVEGEIRGAEMLPLPWETSAVLDLDEVQSFLGQGNPTYSGFVERFGPPGSIWTDTNAYYELPPEDGQRRYLEIFFVPETDSLDVASVLGELEHIRFLDFPWED